MIKNIFKRLLFIVLFSNTLFAEIKLTQTEVSMLYVSVFNRASEGGGNKYWQNRGMSIAKTADSMLATSSAKQYFGDSLTSTQSFVEHIYLNTLNKTPLDDPKGITFWVGLLDNGTSRGEMVASFIKAVINPVNVGDAQSQFENRVKVSNYMANNVEKAPDDYETSMSFSSGLTVTADKGSIESAKERISSLTDGKNSEDKSQKGLGALVPTVAMLDKIPTAIPVSSYTPSDLPSSFDFSDRMPPVRSQGQQGSCASWAVGYYLKSYHEHIEKNTVFGESGSNDFSNVYSPAFLYNRLKIGSCDGGSYIHENLEMVRDMGIASWNDMPYTDKECHAFPSAIATKNAKCSKILSYSTVRIHDPIEPKEIQDMKYYLSNYNPLVIGIYVFEGFSNHTKIGGESFYKKYNQKGYSGGHAIVVVGYDDSKNAFKIINSWGDDWANDGFLWIDYEVFKKIVFVVYRTEDAKNECDESSSYLSINKQSIVFNRQIIDKSYTQSFILTNTGSVALDINHITVPDGYSIDWRNGTLQAGDKQTVTVTFTPTEEKRYNGKITIDHNADGGNTQIEVSGLGVDKLNPQQNPIANAGDDIIIKLGGEISLDASKSSDSDGTIVNYYWECEKYRCSTSNPKRSFTPTGLKEGTHTYTLTVTDDDGKTDTDTLTITVLPNTEGNLAPLSSITVYRYDDNNDREHIAIATVRPNEPINLYGRHSSDYDGEVVSYEWKEGNQVLSTEDNFIKSDFSIGEHTVILTVKDNEGATDTASITVTIGKENNIVPIAHAGEDYIIKLGDEVRMDTSKSSDSDGYIVEYHVHSDKDAMGFIHLGYKDSPTNSIPLHNYIASIGTHTFTLRVRDSDGGTATDTMTVTVLAN